MPRDVVSRTSVSFAPPARAGHPLAITVLCVAALFLYATGHAEPVRPSVAVHFLEQATFGPTAADVAAVQSLGPSAWLQQQFQTPESPMPDGLDGSQVRAQLLANMAGGQDQLRQRMLFALSQVIVVSATKTGTGSELTPWVRLLSRHAFGNYRTLLREVTLNPTMGKFLDLAYNRKATATTSPNENYARELLQLFSIGLWELNPDGTPRRDATGQLMPTYSQATVAAMARALTGWTFPTAPGATPLASNPPYFDGVMEPRADRHDTGAKVLLRGQQVPAGQSVTADLDAVIDNVFQHPNVPPFVSLRLIRSLVTSNPSPAYVARVSAVFANSGQGVRGDLAAVLTAVLTDPEALTPSASDHGRLKDPVLHLIGLGRALGAQLLDPVAFINVFGSLSERPLTPPTVFSFFSPMAPLPGDETRVGPEFQIYPPALAVQRANVIYGLLMNQYASSYRFDLSRFTAFGGDTAGLVEEVNVRLLFGRMSPDLRQILTAATNAVPTSDAVQRAVGALYLTAMSSEYAVYSGADATGGVSVTEVQPPSALQVVAVQGATVVLQWTPPTDGPVPTGYLLEGGTQPGQVLASVPTGSTATTFSLSAPPGSFYVRLHTLAGDRRSRASNEVPLHVQIARVPSAPTGLIGYADGTRIRLAWRTTFGGGEPTYLRLDVSGSVTTSVRLPLGESFSLDGVPPGTYTLRLRAGNAAGLSGSSNAMTLSFPSACSGAPRPPVNFQASGVGRVLSLSWEAPTAGTAPDQYLLTVTGAVEAQLPIGQRSLSREVPPGTYQLSVQSVNRCGTSPATTVQTVIIR